MSLVLHPDNSFTVVRQIANHTDVSTYYVRAVIRNAYTDAIITTLDLTSRGSQRFSKNWQVPADQTGQGFYISIVTSVYTDSGYTTKSGNYGDEENTYLVQDRLSHRGGGARVDYFRIGQMIEKSIKTIPQPQTVEMPEIPKYEMRWDDILKAIDKIELKAEKIEQKETDLTPILNEIRDTKAAIEAKEVTPPTDLGPVLSKMEEAKEDTTITADEVKFLMTSMEQNLREVISQEIATVKETIENMTYTSTVNMEPKGEAKPKQEDAVPFDIKQLAL